MNRYQTLERRALALLIDIGVFLPLILIEVYFVDESQSAVIVGLWTVGYSLVYISYWVILHWRYGQTLGKAIAGVKVVDVGEQAISFKQAILRESFYLVYEAIHVFAALYFLGAGVEAFVEDELNLLMYSFPVAAVWGIVNALVCFKSKKHRALHDFIAGTVVVRLDMLAAEESGKIVDPPGPDAYDSLRTNTDRGSRD